MTWLREFAAIAAILALVAGALVIVLNDRRWMLVMLAGEYLAQTWLSTSALPLQVAAVKLVAGMMACAVLALSVVRVGHSREMVAKEDLPTGVVFRVIAVFLVSAFAWGLADRAWPILPGAVTKAAALGAMLLMSLGLLHLGISEEPFRVGMALLTSVAGFEILYVAVEPSLAVLALLASIHIGIAVIVSYLVVGAEVLRTRRMT